MTAIGWRLVDGVSHLLERDEREAVRGDLEESGESAWRGFVAVVGLVIRREAALWKDWRPWLAAFGLALPSSLLLMGFSLSVSRSFQLYAWISSNYACMDKQILNETGLALGPGIGLLVCQILLLIGWSWTGGFVVGSLSRRTLWASAALCCSPCLFCLARFHHSSLSRFCLLLFLAPAIWGVRQGLRISRIKLQSAILFAAAVTALTIPTGSSRGPWILTCALTWPAWYMVISARRAQTVRS